MNCTRSYISKTLLTVLVFILASAGCKKALINDPQLFNPGDTINARKTDTFKIETYTVADVPLIASGSPRTILGKMDDPSCGISTCGVYAPFTTSTSNVVFDGTTIDSVVLQLNFTATYGPLTKPVNLLVYEMNEALMGGVDYKSNNSFDIKTPAIGSISFNPDISSVTIVDGDTFTGIFRVKLSSELGQRILDADSADLSSSEAFSYFFKGLYITSDETQPGDGVVYVNPASADNSLILYYDGNKRYELKKQSSTRWVSHYAHQQSGYAAGNAIDHPTNGGDSILYLQSMIGSRLYVKVPDLDDLPDLLVNKAELVLTEISPLIDSSYAPAAALYVYRRQDDAGSARIKDDYIDGLTHLDGNVRSYIDENGSALHQYRINVSRYVQDIVDGDFSNQGLFIHTRPYFSIADRCIIAGGNHSKYKMRLVLYYTPYNP